MPSLQPTIAPLPESANPGRAEFRYEEAFARNIGWLTEWEQQQLRTKKVAIAGMGGVGGVHLSTLARLGIGAFHIADLDNFELANFNRQVGATMSALRQPKAEVLTAMARDINPELRIKGFGNGIDENNIDAFLKGADLFVDGFDFFVLDIRAKVFARCAALGIPAITAAPLGMGTAYLIFMPDRMSFEEYFRLEGLPADHQYVNFLVGLNPKGYHRKYLMDPSRIDLASHRGPSTAIACQLAAGVLGAEAVKILLGRGKVYAAPHYHQFDAYRGKWKRGWLPGGNRHPFQVLKRQIGYPAFSKLSQQAWPVQTCSATTEIEKILDLARWAPSGDNNQPWRFEVQSEDRVVVHVRDQADEDVYDYNNGQPTLLSTGMLLETLRIAASRYGRRLHWDYQALCDHRHRLEITLPRDETVREDPLLPYVTIRSVDRRPFKTTPLTPDQKRALETCLSEEFQIIWHESLAERWRMTRLNALATDIRLRIPEAFRVHQKILDWGRNFSPDKVPVRAIGLDALTLKLMRWAIQDWKRMQRLNRLPGATLMARLQMDYLPGLRCAAHFSVLQCAAPAPGDEAVSILRAGQALQRLWLAATQIGLVSQPGVAPLIFAHYARNDIVFTEAAHTYPKALRLAAMLKEATPSSPDNLLFRGRLGWPASGRTVARSLRRPLRGLLLR